MLHSNQFHINEAWIAFTLNETPLQTRREGSFNCICLMDAASCFILGSALVPVHESEPSETEVRRLLQTAWEHKKEFPATLFLPTGEFGANLAAEASNRGIAVVSVDEHQLFVYIDEARQGLKEYLQRGPDE